MQSKRLNRVYAQYLWWLAGESRQRRFELIHCCNWRGDYLDACCRRPAFEPAEAACRQLMVRVPQDGDTAMSGTSSRTNSKGLVMRSAELSDWRVTLPPGRGSDATNPAATGSALPTMMIGKDWCAGELPGSIACRARSQARPRRPAVPRRVREAFADRRLSSARRQERRRPRLTATPPCATRYTSRPKFQTS